MVDNIVLKPLGLVLIVTAHMVFNGPSQAEVTGILGTNVTLQFAFNVTVTNIVSVYKRNHTKIAGYSHGKCSSREGNFQVYTENMSVFLYIPNLRLNDSGIYWASLFMGSRPPKESNNKVQLIVREENRSISVPPTANVSTLNKDSGSPIVFSTHIVTVLVVSPVVLLATILPLLIWCLVRTKDKQQQQQQSSNATVQEMVEASNNESAPPLVYSVLDFPKRPPAVLEINSSTEYAAVSYLAEKRQG